MREAYRVLRPAGVYALATEYIYEQGNRSRPRERRKSILGEAFTRSEIVDLVVDGPGFALAEGIDFEVDPEEVENVFDTAIWRSDSG